MSSFVLKAHSFEVVTEFLGFKLLDGVYLGRGAVQKNPEGPGTGKIR